MDERNTIHAIIVDDERRSRETLATLLAQHCPDVEVVATAESARDALTCIREHRPDLIFLDIEMPYGNGFELLESIREDAPRVIFTTAYDQYAIKAIRYCALDYLLKPIDQEELTAAVERARREMSTSGKRLEMLLQSMTVRHRSLEKIALPTADELVFVSVSEIIRCEASGNYTTFHLVGGQRVLVAKTLKEYEDLLSDTRFFRAHHSHLVNLDHAEKYVKGDGGYLVMRDHSRVMVSRRRKDDLLRMLARS